MAFCRKCGLEIEKNANFCRNCGTTTEGISRKSSRARQPRRVSIAVSVIISVLLFAGITASLFFFTDVFSFISGPKKPAGSQPTQHNSETQTPDSPSPTPDSPSPTPAVFSIVVTTALPTNAVTDNLLDIEYTVNTPNGEIVANVYYKINDCVAQYVYLRETGIADIGVMGQSDCHADA